MKKSVKVNDLLPLLENDSPFRGKKVLFFLALAYHSRLLLPVAKALEAHGAEILYFTASAEAAFEITMEDAGLPYKHALDYLTTEVAGRAEYAYQDLAQMWNGMLLDHGPQQWAPHVVVDKVLRAALESYYCFEELFKQEQPDICFSLHETNSWGKELGYLCEQHQIPFFTFQEGLCYATTPMYRNLTEYSTACMLWGQADMNKLLEAGNDQEKIVPVGSIDIADAIHEWTPRRDETRSLYGIQPNQKMILFLMGYNQYNKLDAPELIRFAWEHRDVTLLFKFHPIQALPSVEFAMEELKKCPAVKVAVKDNVYPLLAAADACVLVGNSTTGIEAMAFGKPLIEVPIQEQEYSYSQAIPQALTLGEAAQLSYDRIGGLSHEEAVARRQFLAYHFVNYGPDGFDHQAVDRVLAEVKRHL